MDLWSYTSRRGVTQRESSRKDTSTSMGSRHTPTHSKDDMAPRNATSVRSWVTKLMHVRRNRCAQNAQGRDTPTRNAQRSYQNVHCVEVPTSHLAETARYYTRSPMSSTLKMLQLNTGKRREVQQSLLNDEELKDFAILAIAEPHAIMIDNKLITSPTGHRNWTKMVPTTRQEGRWPIHSMMWVRSDIEATQVPIESANLTAAILKLPDRRVLVISVYIPCQDQETLAQEIQHMEEAIQDTRRKHGT